ncbi:reverse transcriptase domain-containing protein, partial [Tanacetum coccineum]
ALNGRLAALGHFLAKSTERSLPFFKTLKGCLNKKGFQWSTEAETAFQELKNHLQSLPALTIPRSGETLVLYLAAAAEAIRRLAKWAIELGEHEIIYKPRSAIKGQILADFLAECPADNNETIKKTSQISEKGKMLTWTLFTDGASSMEGSGAGLILTDPDGQEITYALRFNFRTSNNEAEYEALVAGLELAIQMEAQWIDAYTDSLLIVNQVKGVYQAREDLMKRYLSKVQGLSIDVKTVSPIEEVGPTWMDPILNYLKTGALPNDTNEARKIRIKAPQYSLKGDVLYRKGYLTPWLRCVGPEQASYVLREAHFGSCSAHARARTIAQKVARLGYYWPNMYRDAAKIVEECHKCQQHALTIHQPQTELTSISSPWSFYQWGIDIVGPFSEAP